VEQEIQRLLQDIQKSLYDKALEHRMNKTSVAADMDEFKEKLGEVGGFIKAMWCGGQSCEDAIKEETQATSRCIPFVEETVSDSCVFCGKAARELVYWAKAY